MPAALPTPVIRIQIHEGGHGREILITVNEHYAHVSRCNDGDEAIRNSPYWSAHLSRPSLQFTRMMNESTEGNDRQARPRLIA
jgi:uncharacterized membrane protein